MTHPQSAISKHRRARVFARYAVCVYCGREFGKQWEQQPTIDHVLPVSRGGTKHETNLVGCCRACNASKDDRTPEEWAAAILAAVQTIQTISSTIPEPAVRRREKKRKPAEQPAFVVAPDDIHEPGTAGNAGFSAQSH